MLTWLRSLSIRTSAISRAAGKGPGACFAEACSGEFEESGADAATSQSSRDCRSIPTTSAQQQLHNLKISKPPNPEPKQPRRSALRPTPDLHITLAAIACSPARISATHMPRIRLEFALATPAMRRQPVKESKLLPMDVQKPLEHVSRSPRCSCS
jgi:hypothetical protein